MRERHGLLLPGNKHHLGGRPSQGLVQKPLVGSLDHHPVVRKELGEATRGVKPDAVFARAPLVPTRPRRSNGQQS